jgi:hypothetical protein
VCRCMMLCQWDTSGVPVCAAVSMGHFLEDLNNSNDCIMYAVIRYVFTDHHSHHNDNEKVSLRFITTLPGPTHNVLLVPD